MSEIDYISRQDAIDTIAGTVASPSMMLDTLLLRLYTLPSADVRKNERGEWIEIKVGTVNSVYDSYVGIITEWRCDKWNEQQLTRSLFCPNCGADMRGEQDG